MKIVILAGGTGSIQLQTGLYNELEKDVEGIDVKVLINAYDSGLSTGLVRKVLDGKILGPSDARKNQTTRLKLENPDSPYNKLLALRFTQPADTAREYCIDAIYKNALQLPIYDGEVHKAILTTAVNSYFDSPTASIIDYEDFSLANIIYAGLAKLNGNSLRKATSIMAGILGIKDNVILNDDTPFYLGAVSKSGVHVTDEGDIVNWGKLDDPFVDVTFTDVDGRSSRPTLCKEAIDALLEADLIILSSGTQWSSLIPTYASVGFTETIARCTGKIVMVMNRVPDHDCPGQTASDIISTIIPRYFPKGRVRVVIDSEGAEGMRDIDESCKELIDGEPVTINKGHNRLHDPIELVKGIGKAYFGSRLISDAYVFDYDDTLVGRGNTFPKASAFNTYLFSELNKLTSMYICTGNTIKSVNTTHFESLPYFKSLSHKYAEIRVFADGGVNLYTFNPDAPKGTVPAYNFQCMVDPDALAESEANGSSLKTQLEVIKIELINSGISAFKLDMRGDVMLAIKPIESDYRMIISKFIKMLNDDYGYDLNVRLAGRSTIEVTSKCLSKLSTIKWLNANGLTKLTYVGDEFKANGNDVILYGCKGVNCIPVTSPAKTAFFLYSLMSIKEQLNDL